MRSRDPDFPKSIRTRRSAIEREIEKLSRESLDSRSAFAALQRVQKHIEAFERHARYKEGVDVDALGRVFWKKASLAKDQAIENYRAGLSRELSNANERLRESRRAEDPYTRELRLYGVGTKPGPSRDRGRARRRRTSKKRSRR